MNNISEGVVLVNSHKVVTHINQQGNDLLKLMLGSCRGRSTHTTTAPIHIKLNGYKCLQLDTDIFKFGIKLQSMDSTFTANTRLFSTTKSST